MRQTSVFFKEVTLGVSTMCKPHTQEELVFDFTVGFGFRQPWILVPTWEDVQDVMYPKGKSLKYHMPTWKVILDISAMWEHSETLILSWEEGRDITFIAREEVMKFMCHHGK